MKSYFLIFLQAKHHLTWFRWSELQERLRILGSHQFIDDFESKGGLRVFGDISKSMSYCKSSRLQLTILFCGLRFLWDKHPVFCSILDIWHPVLVWHSQTCSTPLLCGVPTMYSLVNYRCQDKWWFIRTSNLTSYRSKCVLSMLRCTEETRWRE